MPGREGWTTNQQIMRAFHGTGGEHAPLLPVVTLPAGRAVDSPAVQRELGEVEARLLRVLPGSRLAGYATEDLSGNEMAKLHVRHMVGGRSPDVRDERLFRFEFPERPGALLEFLEKLGGRWNISLFHYRNHGADSGRVLAGFEVPAAEEAAFQAFLRALGYPFVPEVDNPAYGLFLAAR